MLDETHNPWTILGSREVYNNRWIHVREDQVLNPAGGPGIYGVVHYHNKAIGIVPVDADGNVWLVGQYRYPLCEYSWEIPEGGGPVGEDVLAGAQRELKEETGLTAQRWTLMSRLHLSNSTSDEEGFLFLAQDLSEGESEPEDTERLHVRKMPLAEALGLVMDNRITDSLAVVGLLKAHLILSGMPFSAPPLPPATQA